MTDDKKVTSLLLVPMKDNEESVAHINCIRQVLQKHAAEIGHIVKEQIINISDTPIHKENKQQSDTEQNRRK